MANMYELQDELDKEIKRLQKKLTTLDPSADAYKKVANELERLYELRMKQHQADVRLESEEQAKEAERALREKEVELDDQKAKADRELREKELAFSEQKHQDELAEAKKDRRSGWLRTGIDVVLTGLKVGGTVLCTVLMLNEGYDFERTGTPTSTTFREARKTLSDAIKNLHKR